MNVQIRNEYRVEVGLSPEDLKHYGITYEEIDYKNIETRRMLWSLTEEIRRQNGINIRLSGRLLIEVIKEADSNIKICFSSLPDKTKDSSSIKQLIKSESLPVIAEFSDFEELISTAALLKDHIRCSLYERDGRYRLVMFTDEDNKRYLIPALYEFGKTYESNAIEAARCEEFWTLISADAIKKLKEAFLRG